MNLVYQVMEILLQVMFVFCVIQNAQFVSNPQQIVRNVNLVGHMLPF